MGVYEIKCWVYFEIHCIMNTADQRAIPTRPRRSRSRRTASRWHRLRMTRRYGSGTRRRGLRCRRSSATLIGSGLSRSHQTASTRRQLQTTRLCGFWMQRWEPRHRRSRATLAESPRLRSRQRINRYSHSLPKFHNPYIITNR
jgi:hypothetical protein